MLNNDCSAIPKDYKKLARLNAEFKELARKSGGECFMLELPRGGGYYDYDILQGPGAMSKLKKRERVLEGHLLTLTLILCKHDLPTFLETCLDFPQLPKYLAAIVRSQLFMEHFGRKR